MSEVEICSGCGTVADEHPFVAIMLDQEVKKYDRFPVCEKCWRDPSNRKSVLKAHFFPREQADYALSRAGSANIGG
jgi:hypothetical protein